VPDKRAIVRAKVAKASEFLLFADFAVSEKAWDVACSLSASAAINASDALIVALGGAIPSRDEHAGAVRTLSRLADTNAGRQLVAALKTKSKSQYEMSSCTESNAQAAMKAAERLVTRAKEMDSDD
jgi:HEPN domain-containing protein